MRGRILLVDDDAGLCAAYTALLAQRDHEVTVCHDVAQAQRALGARVVDLVLTDIHMPGGSGLRLLDELSRSPETPRVIVMTGQPSIGSAIDALRLSAVDYLVKPIPPRDLLDRIDIALEKGRAVRQLHHAREHAKELVQTLEALEPLLASAAIEPPRRPSAPPPAMPTAATATTTANGASPRSASPDGASPNGTAASTLADDALAALSGREREVVTLVVEARSVREIAKQLFISEHTVRNHLRAIYAKLDVHSRVELVRRVMGTPPR
ncbi:MAG: response regulator [Myxococcales bacterium]|nr:response regulator [Myxococcales bacterium]